MHRAITAAAVAAGISTPLYAGNIAPPMEEPIVAPAAPVMVPPVTSSSNWTGGYVGAQLGFGSMKPDDGTVADTGSGVFGGLHAGYDYDFGKLVLGGSAQADFGDLGSSVATLKNEYQIKARAGYDFGNTLAYVTAGGANAMLDTPAGDLRDWGYVAGAGLDYKVTERVTLGAEYLYHDYRDVDSSAIDVTGHSLQAKVGFRF